MLVGSYSSKHRSFIWCCALCFGCINLTLLELWYAEFVTDSRNTGDYDWSFYWIFSDFFLNLPKTVPSVETVIKEGCPGTYNKNLPLVITFNMFRGSVSHVNPPPKIKWNHWYIVQLSIWYDRTVIHRASGAGSHSFELSLKLPWMFSCMSLTVKWKRNKPILNFTSQSETWHVNCAHVGCLRVASGLHIPILPLFLVPVHVILPDGLFFIGMIFHD